MYLYNIRNDTAFCPIKLDVCHEKMKNNSFIDIDIVGRCLKAQYMGIVMIAAFSYACTVY